MDKIFRSIIHNVPSYARFLSVREIDALVQEIVEMPGITHHVIGKTVNDEDLSLLEIGDHDPTALIIGVPHSDEPLGSLVTTYFARWLARHPQEVKSLGWRWLFIPVLERRGMRLNEMWFNVPDSLAAMARTSFREPTEDQYEWSFPIEYEGYQWTVSRPETHVVQRVIKQERPQLLCGLHHSGFTNGYYYFSRDIPELYLQLRRFAAGLGIPLADRAPDVPFGRMLSPGFYQMYGLKDYLEYYAKKDPKVILSLKRGACSDEWYQDIVSEGFSFNCEVPMFLTPKLQDKSLSLVSYKDMRQQQYQRKKIRVAYSRKLFDKLQEYAHFADPMLYTMAQKHVANAQMSLAHEKHILSTMEERPVSKAELFENMVIADLFDLFFIGQIWRVSESICIKGEAPKICRLMEAADVEITSLAKGIEQQGNFYQVPLRTAVKMQLGSILIIAEGLRSLTGSPAVKI
jgi:hypothetical protein